MRKAEPQENLSHRTPRRKHVRCPRQALIGSGQDGKVEIGTPELRMHGTCLVGNRNAMSRLGKGIRGGGSPKQLV